MAFEIEPFFPYDKLNPQGWITDFITSRLHRIGKERSTLANLFYDEIITDATAKDFDIKQDLKDEIQNGRKRTSYDKSIYINPKYYDAIERNTFVSAKVLEDERKMRDYYKYMTNIKPSELASFVPYVNIIYAYKEANESTFTEASVPFVQNLNTEVASILADKFSRGQGAGVRSVSANRSFPGLGLTLNIEVSVTYFFSSLSLLTKKISNNNVPEKANFSYSKLFTHLNSGINKLVLEYGYGINPQDSNISYKSISDIVTAERKRVPLIYRSHKLTIQENGSVDLSVTYLAQSEAQLFQRNDVSMPSLNFLQKANYLSKSEQDMLTRYNQIKIDYYNLEEQIKSLEVNKFKLQQVGGGDKKDQIKKIETEKKELKKQLQIKSKALFSTKSKSKDIFKNIILKELVRRRQMFAISFTTEKKDNLRSINTFLYLVKEDEKQKLNFVQLGKPKVYSQDINNFKDLKNKKVLDNNSLNLSGEDVYKILIDKLFDTPVRPKPANGAAPQFAYISFFPLKALISIIYNLLPDPANDPSMKEVIPYTCFGNVVARSFDKEYTLNIGDILIEREVFSSWLYKNFDQVERTEYSFASVMKNIMEELVPNAIERYNTGFYGKSSIGTIRHLTYYTKKNVTKDNKLLQQIYDQPEDLSVIRQIFTPERDKDALPLIYYTQMLNPLNDFTSPYHKKYITKKSLTKAPFSLDDDSLMGIPHAVIGSSAGLIKKINFNAIEQPYLASSLAFQALADGNTRIPRLPYKLEIEMIGNNLFSQAGFVAVPPFGSEEEQSATGVDVALGITGYYVVTRVSDQISVDGNYQTSISATWHTNPLDDKNKNDIGRTKSSNGPTELQEYIKFNVIDYMKDLLEQDPETLKSLGITARVDDKPKKTNEEQKQSNKEKKKRDRPPVKGIK